MTRQRGIALAIPTEVEAAAFLSQYAITKEFLVLALVAEGQRVDPGDDEPVLMVRALIALAGDRQRQGRSVQPELQELVDLWLDRCAAEVCASAEWKPETGTAVAADEPIAVPAPG